MAECAPSSDCAVSLSHGGHVVHAGHGFALVVLAALSGLALALYVLGAAREHRRGRAWSRWRVSSFAAGCLAIIAALLPPLATFAHADLRIHMVQHLLLGMLGPVGVVLGAPMTLALRTLPKVAGRRIVRLLHSRFVRVVSHPLTAALLNVGGMALLYFTPLYAAMADSSALHAFVHVHFVAAGCLYAWAIAGADPSPSRPSFRTRLAVLFIATAAHATVAKSMFAYGWPRGTAHPLAEIEQAAQLMYYGGHVAELLLVVAFFAAWFRGGAYRRGRVGAAGAFEAR